LQNKKHILRAMAQDQRTALTRKRREKMKKQASVFDLRRAEYNTKAYDGSEEPESLGECLSE